MKYLILLLFLSLPCLAEYVDNKPIYDLSFTRYYKEQAPATYSLELGVWLKQVEENVYFLRLGVGTSPSKGMTFSLAPFGLGYKSILMFLSLDPISCYMGTALSYKF